MGTGCLLAARLPYSTTNIHRSRRWWWRRRRRRNGNGNQKRMQIMTKRTYETRTKNNLSQPNAN